MEKQSELSELSVILWVSVKRGSTLRVPIYSIGVKFQLVSKFTELHALNLAAHSHALLCTLISQK